MWTAKDEFQPIPGLLDIVRETLARFTFTIGPLLPTGPTAQQIILLSGVTWAVTLIGWLGWALWLSVPGRRLETSPPSDVESTGRATTTTSASSMAGTNSDANTDSDPNSDPNSDTKSEGPDHD